MNKPTRLFLALSSLLFFASPAFSETNQVERRIEEEKRTELAETVEQPSSVKIAELPRSGPGQPLGNAPPPLQLKEVYFAQLSKKRVVFRYDAAKAVTILMNADKKYIDLASQVAFLQEQKYLPGHYEKSFDPMLPLRKGLASYLFYRMLGIEGGIALHLFGPSERYAMKELGFQGFLSQGHVDDLVSGEEFVQILNRVTEHRMRSAQKAP